MTLATGLAAVGHRAHRAVWVPVSFESTSAPLVIVEKPREREPGDDETPAGQAGGGLDVAQRRAGLHHALGVRHNRPSLPRYDTHVRCEFQHDDFAPVA